MTTAIAEAKRELHGSYGDLVRAWARGEQSFSPGESEHTITAADLPFVLTAMGRTFPAFERDVEILRSRFQWAREIEQRPRREQRLEEIATRSRQLDQEQRDLVNRLREVSQKIAETRAEYQRVAAATSITGQENLLRQSADPAVRQQIDALEVHKTNVLGLVNELQRKSEVRSPDGRRLRRGDLEARLQGIDQELQLKPHPARRDQLTAEQSVLRNTVRQLAEVEEQVATAQQQLQALESKIAGLWHSMLDPATVEFLR